MQAFQYNPDSRLAANLSHGFQRDEITKEPATQRDFFRITLQGTSALTRTEPVSRAGLKAFRSDAVTACLEFAAITRTGTGPVLLHLNSYQQNCVNLNASGGGTSFVNDSVLGVITSNTGNTFRPTPDSSGAQLQLTNILGQPLEFAFSDLTGAVLTDVTSFYFSIIFFERVI